MKWAFEYACKICEEQLPNTLPLNIHEKKRKKSDCGVENSQLRHLATQHP